MSDPLTAQLEEKIVVAGASYNRLVLLVGAPGSGKTAILQRMADRFGTKTINVNLELSQKLLELSERERQLQLQRLLGDIVDSAGGETVFLDNIELLFDEELRADPLRLLQRLSRNRTVVAAWNGDTDNGSVTYAEANHPEYRSYSADDLLLVHLK